MLRTCSGQANSNATSTPSTTKTATLSSLPQQKTTSSSSSIHSSSNIYDEIDRLKDHNASLHKRIMNIKLSQRTFHSNRTSFLKNYHKGHRLRAQINKTNTIYRQFLNLFNSRFNLFFTNVANLMDLDLQLQRSELINRERNNLSSCNVHACHARDKSASIMPGMQWLRGPSYKHVLCTHCMPTVPHNNQVAQ